MEGLSAVNDRTVVSDHLVDENGDLNLHLSVTVAFMTHQS